MDLSVFAISQETAKTYFYVCLILLIGVFLDHILRSFVKVPKHFDNRRARTFATIIRNIITIIVYTMVIFQVFALLNINVTPFLASAGIIGVAVGIGARPIIEDLITGLFLLSQNSIAIGDYIKVDEAEGTIETIGFRTLSIRHESGALYIIPNGQIKKVVNFSRHRSNVIIDVPVKIDQEITAVLKAVTDALTQLQKDKEVASSLYSGSKINGLEDFKPTGPMLIRVTIITYPARRFEIARKYRYFLKKEFEKNKLQFG